MKRKLVKEDYNAGSSDVMPTNNWVRNGDFQAAPSSLADQIKRAVNGNTQDLNTNRRFKTPPPPLDDNTPAHFAEACLAIMELQKKFERAKKHSALGSEEKETLDLIAKRFAVVYTHLIAIAGLVDDIDTF